MKKLNRIYQWFKIGLWFWFAIIIIIWAIVLLLKAENINQIKVCGMIWQILGSSTIIASLFNKLKQTRNESLITPIKLYILDFPLWRKPKHYTLEAKTGEFKITGYDPLIKVSPNHDVPSLIKYIDDQISQVSEHISQAEVRVKENISETREEIYTRLKEIKSDIEHVKKVNPEISPSDVFKEYFAFFSLVLGIIFATIPDLILP